MFQWAQSQTPLRDAITDAYRQDEAQAVSDLLTIAHMDAQEREAVGALARRLVTQVRASRTKASGVDALMHEFSLSSEEGVALMCLAEALLRVPDKATQNKLIQDKLAGADWRAHVNQSPSLFVNAAAWGLLLTGKLTAPTNEQSLSAALTRMLGKGGEPLIRKGIDYAMRLLGKQFVTGQTIDEALASGKEREKMGYRFSFDMLGEAALTQADADRYFQDYVTAIHAIGKDSAGRGVYDGNGISVKLSAIHPRYQRAQRERVMAELLPRLKELFVLAKQYDIGLNIDAEEANRLELSLDLIEALALDADLAGFKGIGIVVQAYQKRCPFVIDYLVDLARRSGRRFMVRLVKGAYWDSEIKWAQVDGLEGYPVYTRKVHTDVSYLACARKLLAAQDAVFPQFASHNAYTVAAIFNLAGDKDYEFQCLHGMGETLYNQVVGSANLGRRVRIYAPVGTHETLLAYLVRRLLENGANSSFVNQIVDEQVSIDDLVRCPLDEAAQNGGRMHAGLRLPRHLYGEARLNSRGVDLSNEHMLAQLQAQMNQAAATQVQAASLLADAGADVGTSHAVLNPARHSDVVGQVTFATLAQVDVAIGAAVAAQAAWAARPAAERAGCLKRFADLLEHNQATLMMLAVREAGKTLNNAIAEVREAVDFCRYYAHEAEHTLNPGDAPLGTVVAISPWNFPLAIFVGETVSAWVAGNTVLTKPAEQTSLIAHYAVQLMHEAGVPRNVVQLVLGAGDIGAALTRDERINGVIFTGSTEVARLINHSLAKRSDLPVLVAETGGQNAMIVDSTALPEQVVNDVLVSAFDSAGPRCSALRGLCLQDDIADHFLTMLKGAMQELHVGDPRQLAVDIGPVIDAEAQQNLLGHIERMKGVARACHQVRLPEYATEGTYVPPTLLELSDLSQLQREVFGPVLHVLRYRADQLDGLIDQINAAGYALTHGIHSRIDRTVDHICNRIEAGNVYVNRNIVGAVVGVQPFGGHGLSGTGPKAGGPFYLQRLNQSRYWHLPHLDVAGQSDRHTLDALEQRILALDLSAQQRALLAAAVGRARIGCLKGAEQVLPGPTGEQNTLSWHAPKAVYLFGGDLAQSLAAVVELAAAGTQVRVAPNHPLAAQAAQLSPWVQVDEAPHQANISACVALSPLSVADKTLLAGRDGALVRLIDASHGLDMLQVYQEISRSINTTAAGGNASLMAMSDK